MIDRIANMLFILGFAFAVLAGVAWVYQEGAPAALNVEVCIADDTAARGCIVLLDDAPDWCLEPGFPRGDTWYEGCVEPIVSSTERERP